MNNLSRAVKPLVETVQTGQTGYVKSVGRACSKSRSVDI